MTNEEVIKFVDEADMPCYVKVRYTMKLTPGGRGKHVIEYEYDKVYELGGDYKKRVNNKATNTPVHFGTLKGVTRYDSIRGHHMLFSNDDGEMILQVFEVPGEKSENGRYILDGRKPTYSEIAWIEELRDKQKTDYNSNVQKVAGIAPEDQIRPRSLLVDKISSMEIVKLNKKGK